MDRSFNLFAERPFNAYAHERFSAIAKSINNMSNVEVLMYKNDFDGLVRQLVKAYSLAPVSVSFEDKLVDLTSRPYRDHDRYFAEYTLSISGDINLLTLCPYKPGFVKIVVPAEIKTNVLIFEIDTQYYNANLTQSVMENVKRAYLIIKDFISESLLYLNNESQKFNFEIEQFIIPVLANKLRVAQNHVEIREKLNFN